MSRPRTRRPGSAATTRGAGPAWIAALLVAAVTAAPAAAQEPGGGLDGPLPADAPDQFRVSAVAGWVGWSGASASGEQSMESASALGLDLETRVSPYLAFRFGGTYGETSITGTDEEGESRSVDAHQLLLELVAAPRLPLDPLREVGVVPFGLLGLGSVVHDPQTEEGEFDPPLVTRSQGSVIYGLGVEVEPASLGSFGARLEWRRAEVQVQNIFVSTAREGTGRGSDRILGTFYWRF